MINMIKYFIILNTLTTVLAVVTLAAVVWIVVKLFRQRHSQMLRSLPAYIDSIPFFAGLVAVTGFLNEIYHMYRAVTAIHTSGVGDPRVAAAGFQEFFFTMTVTGGLFFVFLEAWLIMRMIYGRFLHEFETLPK